MKKDIEKDVRDLAEREIKMWRKRYIDHELFHDSKEEKWFTEMLMSNPVGLRDIDEYADFMLKGYRKTKRETHIT